MIRLWYGLTYVLWIVVEIVKGSMDVAKGAYSRGTKSSPAIVEFPLRCTTDAEIIAMASSITITPGTLVVGTAHGTEAEHPSLFVHALFAESREQVLADLTDMEDRLLRVTRGRAGAQDDPARGSGGTTDPDHADGRAARRIDEGPHREVAPSEPVVGEEER
ncbi:Na+/H+ antiporter subunit E [Brachybacterium sp. p3-SID1565]|uniref:Na+/H+ antiporter subunit E n=1 Tax=Brachybacterium epidermidis TaxID=2781983 RepID=A0ABR9VYR8_9MICO|nr:MULTISPECIES: Na+/H+ antiporter subunit E [Brachybacterium]MBE9403342.1 Na+/H+ antiporter subunit E [Brachybacterium epidermidis]MCT1384535.1 Na+/H+ antiporter subunit E [Brachybacterium sp. p3-SID1565]